MTRRASSQYTISSKTATSSRWGRRADSPRSIPPSSSFGLTSPHFPSQEPNGARHFYTHWDLCGRLHQHIVAFYDRCQSPKNRSELPTNDPTFIDLIRDNAWYMVETQQFLEAGSALLSILGDIEDGSLLAATVQRSLLGLYE